MVVPGDGVPAAGRMHPSGVVVLGAEGPDAQVLPDEVPGGLGGKLVERRFPGRMVPIQPFLQREAEAALDGGVGREALLFRVRPHPIEKERPYRIVTEIQLPAIDYENFITDMLADRQFIEDHGRR